MEKHKLVALPLHGSAKLTENDPWDEEVGKFENETVSILSEVLTSETRHLEILGRLDYMSGLMEQMLELMKLDYQARKKVREETQTNIPSANTSSQENVRANPNPNLVDLSKFRPGGKYAYLIDPSDE